MKKEMSIARVLFWEVLVFLPLTFFAHTHWQKFILSFLVGFVTVFVLMILTRLPRWYHVITFIFPLLYFVFSTWVKFSFWWYAGLFIFSFIIFTNVHSEQVPLYLSNQKTIYALKKIRETYHLKKFLDLGSGVGTVVILMDDRAGERPTGVENALLLFLISSLISKVLRRGEIKAINLWDISFSEFDFIYAFLSPAVMEKLEQKLINEMGKESVFVSNSFQLPHLTPQEVWELDDRRKTQLYIYTERER